MGKEQKAVVVLNRNKECRKVARFDHPDQANFTVVKNLYISNEVYNVLGKPKKLKVTMEAAQ